MIPLWDHDSGDEDDIDQLRRLESRLRELIGSPVDQALVFRHEGGFHIFGAPAGSGQIRLWVPADPGEARVGRGRGTMYVVLEGKEIKA